MFPRRVLLLSLLFSLVSHGVLLSTVPFLKVNLPNSQKDALFVKLEDLPYGQEERGITETPPLEQSTGKIAPEEPSEKVLSLDSNDRRYAPYLIKIKRRIERIWTYPFGAYRQKKGGINRVRFTLDNKGNLVATHLVQSSGVESLDRETLRAVTQAAPYDPFPPEVRLTYLHILATFHYRIL